MTWWHSCNHLCLSLAIGFARIPEGEEKDNTIQKSPIIGERAMSTHPPSHNARTLQRSSNKTTWPNLKLRQQTARPAWKIVNIPNKRSLTPSRRCCKPLNLGRGDAIFDYIKDYNESDKFSTETRKSASPFSHHYLISRIQRMRSAIKPISKWRLDFMRRRWWNREYLSCRWEESRFFFGMRSLAGMDLKASSAPSD